MDDAPNGKEDQEEDEETAHPVDHVIEFHDARSGEALTDLDGEGDHQDHRQDIQEGYDHGMASLCKPEKEGVENQNEGDAQNTDGDEMEFLVGKAVLALVVQCQYIGMDTRDERDDGIQEIFHGNCLRVCQILRESTDSIAVECEETEKYGMENNVKFMLTVNG